MSDRKQERLTDSAVIPKRNSWESQSHQKHMNSIIPPMREERAHITAAQEEEEAAHREREEQRPRELAQLRRIKDDEKERNRSSLASKLELQASPAELEDDDSDRVKAAILIQRVYRGHRVRREIKVWGIDATTRWTHAVRDAQWRQVNRPRARSEMEDEVSKEVADEAREGQSTRKTMARRKWKKVALIARRAVEDIDGEDTFPKDASESEDSRGSANMRRTPEQAAAWKKRREEARAQRRKDAKMMGLQYFLEMVDLKHRYGSNLRTYHEEWKKSDTKENFFYWLDHGDGRYVDIQACPRVRLDRERVRYLSREERQYYLVKVDDEGRLVWAKNGVRIDTTEAWKDSIYGIVPAGDPTPNFSPPVDPDEPAVQPQTPHFATKSELEAARAANSAMPGLGTSANATKIQHMSASTIFNKLLRKSVRKNTWIFVVDTRFRLYVGIKKSGAFQHSSFLQGSRISAAGLIKVKNGRLTSLSPLSGHYRPPASNFRAFVRSMREEGVDTRRASVSKSYVVLMGLEAWMRGQRKGKDMVKRFIGGKKRWINSEGEMRGVEESDLFHSRVDGERPKKKHSDGSTRGLT